MTDDQIIEAAIQGHASTRDAILWAMKHVRMQSNTHQLPSVSAQNTHQTDDVARHLLVALRMVLDDQDALDGRPRTYEYVKKALAAAQEAGL